MSAGLAILLICLLAGLLALACCAPSFLRARRRARLMSQAAPPEWDSLLERNLSIYNELPSGLKDKLKSLALVFLAEKRFEGCGGLSLTDEMKLIIAAEACLLLLGRPKPSFFPALGSVLVYPSAFYSRESEQLSGGEWLAEDDAEKLGESWHQGAIILSWEHVKREGNMLNDGLNVVCHEFAHQLDEERGFADGTPSLEESGLSYSEWSEVMSREYASFLRDVRRGRRSPIDEYGSSNPAEFFAVATESFFEKPLQLRSRHPRLYGEFKSFYGLDPAAWREAAQAREPGAYDSGMSDV